MSLNRGEGVWAKNVGLLGAVCFPWQLKINSTYPCLHRTRCSSIHKIFQMKQAMVFQQNNGLMIPWMSLSSIYRSSCKHQELMAVTETLYHLSKSLLTGKVPHLMSTLKMRPRVVVSIFWQQPQIRRSRCQFRERNVSRKIWLFRRSKVQSIRWLVCPFSPKVHRSSILP